MRERKFNWQLLLGYLLLILTLIWSTIHIRHIEEVALLKENELNEQEATIGLLSFEIDLLSNRISNVEYDTNYYESLVSSLKAENIELREYATTYNSDLDLLARIIYAEAGGSTEEDMFLVGNVVLNRVAHDAYPDTIRDVIYQSGQYTPTRSGTINNIPSDNAIEIARRLMDGERQAPENVVYQSQAIQGRGIWKKVGLHYYCYR